MSGFVPLLGATGRCLRRQNWFRSKRHSDRAKSPLGLQLPTIEAEGLARGLHLAVEQKLISSTQVPTFPSWAPKGDGSAPSPGEVIAG